LLRVDQNNGHGGNNIRSIRQIELLNAAYGYTYRVFIMKMRRETMRQIIGAGEFNIIKIADLPGTDHEQISLDRSNLVNLAAMKFLCTLNAYIYHFIELR
jgi:hypothetical protein